MNDGHTEIDGVETKVISALHVMDRMFVENALTALDAVTTFITALGTTVAKAIPPEKHEEAIDQIFIELRAMVSALIDEENERKQQKITNDSTYED
jgi:hypothetical protein